MERRKYPLRIWFNGVLLDSVIIDLHYLVKHSASISDEVIIELVKILDETDMGFEVERGEFEYYMRDDLILHGKIYRLVWLVEKNQTYIGVINAYRRK